MTTTTSGIPAQSTAPGAPAPTPDAPARPRRQWELDALRIAAICGVLAIHVVGMMLGNDDIKGSLRWWGAVAIDIGLVWVVPVFVMISGALVLAPRAHAEGPGAFYRKRFVRILPALLVWHLVYLLGVRVGIKGEELTRTEVTMWLIDAKVYTALYFLWLIAGLYIVAPVIAAFLAGGGQRRAIGTAAVALGFTLVAFSTAGVASIAGEPRPIYLGALTMWWPYVGYFVAGWALHRVVLPVWGIVVAAVVAVVLLAEVVWQYGNRPAYPWLQQLASTGYLGWATAIASLCILLVAVGIGARVTPGPRVTALLKRLSDASFGVFLVHLLVFELVRQAVPAVAEAASLSVMLVAWGVVVVLSFAMSLIAARIPYVRAVF